MDRWNIGCDPVVAVSGDRGVSVRVFYGGVSEWKGDYCMVLFLFDIVFMA